MQNNVPVNFREVRDLGQIVNATFVFLRQEWRPLFRAIATLCLPFAVVGGFLAGGSMAGLQTAGVRADTDPFSALTTMKSSLLGAIPGYLLLVVGYVLLISLVHEYLRLYQMGQHRSTSTGELIKQALGQVGPYLGASFISWLLLFVGLMLFFFPFFYAWTVLSLAYAAHAMERTGGSGAITRSYNLVKGDFWPMLGLLLVIGMIQYLLMYVVQLPALIVGVGIGINSGLQMLENNEPGLNMPTWYSAFTAFTTALQWCAMMLVHSVSATCMTLKYFSLVEQKEGRGLQEKIQGFEQA